MHALGRLQVYLAGLGGYLLSLGHVGAIDRLRGEIQVSGRAGYVQIGPLIRNDETAIRMQTDGATVQDLTRQAALAVLIGQAGAADIEMSPRTQPDALVGQESRGKCSRPC